MVAIRRGHTEVARTLVKHMEGEGLDAKDKNGQTALHQAVVWRRAELVDVLLSKGAQVDVRDVQGNTPLMVAIRRGDIEVARMILQHTEGEGLEARDEQGKTVLQLAVYDGSHVILALLLEHGAIASSKDGNGVTPLMNAALGDSLTSVQLLIQHVGEQGLQERDQKGRTALHYAIARFCRVMPGSAEARHCDFPSLAMVQVLLEAGVDPSITDRAGRTPRALAMEIGLQRCGRMCEVRIHAIEGGAQSSFTWR
jgi:ankyrin repeat protein